MKIDESLKEILENQAGTGKECKGRITIEETISKIKVVVRKSLGEKKKQVWTTRNIALKTKTEGYNQHINEMEEVWK